ncbi:MAG: DUF2059 domain-containing protein [Sphingomicrobium sp.]
MVGPLLLLAAAAAQPPAQALKLGRQIAESGVLGIVLPIAQHKETEELVAAHPELTAVERARLRETAKRVFEDGRERLMQAEGRAYAEHLSLSDLRAVTAFQQSEAGKRYRAAMPGVIIETMKVMGTMDFKADVLAAYCKETGKLCAK